MRFPPSAFVIGAQKAGTTTLAHVLSLHPDVTLSTPKEPHFFTKYWENGPDWYRTVFRGSATSILIDASTSYTMAPLDGRPVRALDEPLAGVPRRIHSLNPDAKFVYVLRDPVTRTYSHYWHTVRTGEQRLPFRQALEADDSYLRISDYHAQLRKYLEFFPRSAFLFLVFEEMVRDLAGAARRCFEFLGVPAGELSVAESASQHNASFVYRGPARVLARLVSQRGWRALESGARAVIPSRLQPLVAKAVTSRIPPLPERDRDVLVEHFREPIRNLEQLLDRRFDRWRR